MEPLIVEKTLNAPVARVWEALTELEKMHKWYFDISAFKPEVGFEFEFTGGEPDDKLFLHKCVIREVIPFKKLSYSWRYEGYEGDSLVAFELFEGGETTRVKVTHTGLETFPDTPSFAKENFNGGWNHILGVSLKEFVEGDIPR